MKKNKNLMGFTLVELIVVMAIFSILLVGVMKLIDPVSKIMTKAAVQESNSASVNNVKGYIEQSLRYSDFIATYKNGYSVVDGVNRKAATEEDAVKEFVDTYYKNRINCDGSDTPLNGKVRVMKINNKTHGTIDEFIYDFTSAQTYLDSTNVEHTLNVSNVTLETATQKIGAINPDYYKDYSFYITTGYNQMTPISASEASTKYSLSLPSSSTAYFGRLSELKDSTTGNPLYPFGPSMFSLSIVTYKNRDKDNASDANGNYKGNFNFPDDPATALNEESSDVIFKSPYYLANSTVSLVNTSSSYLKAFGLDRDASGNVKVNGGDAVYRDVTPAENRVPVYELPLGTSPDDDGNVYFIYSLPSENR